jgi:hypothetical protein
MANSEMAKQFSAFAEALAEYDHLPMLASVRWNASGHADLEMPDGDLVTTLRGLHGWAAGFDAEITVRPMGHTLAISFEVAIAGFKAHVDDYLYRDNKDAMMAELPETVDGSVTLSPVQFGAIVDRLRDDEGARAWRAARKRHYEVLTGYGVPEADAGALADRKTTAELGPISPEGGVSA